MTAYTAGGAYQENLHFGNLVLKALVAGKCQEILKGDKSRKSKNAWPMTDTQFENVKTLVVGTKKRSESIIYIHTTDMYAILY